MDPDKDSDMQSRRLQQSYDVVYTAEKPGIQRLNLEHWPLNRWEALVHSMPLHACNALEIGCGNGIVLYHIAERCETLTGTDSPYVLAKCMTVDICIILQSAR